MPLLLSVPEFCRQAGIGRSTFYELLREGKGPQITRLRSRVYISRESAIQWVNECEQRTAAERSKA